MANQEFDHEISQEDYEYLTQPRKYPEPCDWCGGRLIHAELCVSRTKDFLPKIQFGKKHRGKPVRDVPSDYLTWALNRKRLLTIDATRAALEKVRSENAATPKELERWERQLREREEEQLET
ncbi:MAG: hypothetical protein AAF662_05295 [Pseudomonadota bacterium]